MFQSYKFNRAIVTGLIAVTVSGAWFSRKAIAELLNWDQHAELWVSGTITDPTSNRKWNVIMIPGATNLNRLVKDGWVDAGKDLSEYFEKKFWENRWGDVVDGYEFSKRTFTRDFIDDIGHEFNRAVERSGSVGWGEFGGPFFKVWTWTKFSMITVWDTAVNGVVLPVGGFVYSLIKPIGHTVLWIPLAATANAIGEGTIAPGVGYIWNGMTWVATSFSPVPQRETFFVTLMAGPKPIVTIDLEGFKLLLQQATLRIVTDVKNADRDVQVKQIEAKIQEVTAPLKDQEKQIRSEEAKDEQAVSASEGQKFLDNVMDKIFSSDVKLDPNAANLRMDQAQLKTLVQDYLKGLGIQNPSEQLVTDIVTLLEKNLKRLGAEMSAQVPANPQP